MKKQVEKIDDDSERWVIQDIEKNELFSFIVRNKMLSDLQIQILDIFEDIEILKYSSKWKWKEGRKLLDTPCLYEDRLGIQVGSYACSQCVRYIGGNDSFVVCNVVI